MRLTYDILCIDDNISSLDKPKNDLSMFNDSVGIETNFKDIEVKIGPREDPEEFLLKIDDKIEELFTENIFDMILVDLHMGAISGADIIDLIRNKHTIYRPIIFYSAGKPSTDLKAIKQLNEAITESKLLGRCVLITPRDNIFDMAASIFKEMHIEEHKVNHVRGLLMDSVSEFDASVVELVKNEKLLALVPGADKPRVARDIKDYLKSDLDRTRQLYDNINRLRFEEILRFIEEHPKDISTYRKGYLLKDILRKIEVTKDFSAILSEGIDGTFRNDRGAEVKNLREIRNEYGHVKAENLEATHSDEKCIHIRKEARRQLKNINDIRECIKGA